MKLYRYLDVFFICLASIILCVFVCARILVKEVLIDKCNLTFAGAEYILYDLNTTIEMPAAESEEQGFDIEKTVEECKYKLTAYTTSAMAFNREIDSVVNYIDTKLINIPATLSNIRYVLEPSDHVIDFAGFVKEADIPFLYVSTPNKDSVLCRMGNETLYEHELSERNWYLLLNLKEAGIDVIDLAQDLADAEMTKYDVSNHWFPENALYAAGVVAQSLNQYGFEFDLSVFDLNNTTDYFEDKEEWEKIIYDNTGYVYSFPIPRAVDNMTFTLEHEGTITEGAYSEVFLKVPDAYTEAAYHGLSVVSNSTLYEFHNLNTQNNKGKRILIIGDSYNWILSDYLIADIEYIDVIHNASYSESIRGYIEKTKPDMVLVIYNDAEFVEIYTQQAFEFD